MSELLLAKSADINASDGNGRPALHQVNARRYPTAAVLTAATQRAQKRTDNREYRCRVGNPVPSRKPGTENRNNGTENRNNGTENRDCRLFVCQAAWAGDLGAITLALE